MSDKEKLILLNNAWCRDCHDANASFAHGYTLRADKFGIVIEGKCAKYGCAIARHSRWGPSPYIAFPRRNSASSEAS